MSALPPPPIQAWADMPAVWKRWFIDLYSRAGGSQSNNLSDIETLLSMSRDPLPNSVLEIAQDYPTAPIQPVDEVLDWLFSARESQVTDEGYEPSRAADHGGWNDVLSDLAQGKVAGANTPNWSAFRNGIFGYEFSASLMNELWINLHVLHDYRWGTKVFPHIHWATTSTNNGVCRWGIEYTFARGYGADVFPATTTIYIEQAATGTAYTHLIAEPTEANGLLLPNCEPDGVLMCRVFRDAAHANDTLTGTAFAFFCDLHFQSDGLLTNERNRTFTKRRV